MNCEKIKKALVSFLVGALLLAGSIVTYANCLYVNSPVLVDGDSWTYVGSATKSTNGSYSTVNITSILDATGDDQGYTKIKVTPTSVGDTYTCYLDTPKNITLPLGYRTVGSNILYFCMGNVPSLDCTITGSFNSN